MVGKVDPSVEAERNIVANASGPVGFPYAEEVAATELFGVT